MARAYLSGFTFALRRWPLVLVLFAGSLLAGLSFTTASWVWLSAALGKSLATRSLLTDLNVQVFIDLFAHHGESLRMLAFSGMVMAVLFAGLGIWLNGVAIAAIDRERSTSECLLHGIRLYSTYVKLWALTMLCMLASTVAVFLLERVLTRWTTESTSEMTFYWVVAGSALVGALLWLFFATVHDHARIRSRTGGTGALRAFGWAVTYVCLRQPHALPLAMLLVTSSVMVWAMHQSVSHFVATNSAFGVTVSLLWGELLLLARMFLRVWWFGAEAQLQQGTEPNASWIAASDRPAA